jgi:hemerythrin-like domain-containing protein
MNAALPGHSSPRATFDEPLAMLAQCHDRAGAQVNTLRRLLAHLPQHGADEQARDAANAVMRYFEIAARDHHADEESDLFPALLEAVAGSDAVCLRELTDSLRAEHRRLEQAWQALRPALQRIAAGESAPLDSAAAEALIGGYQRHIAREDGELIPMAARLLDAATLARIGQAMRGRRGIAPGQ